MFEDLYDYDHPALYMHLVEPGGLRKARRWFKNGRKSEYHTWTQKAGPRRVRRAIKRYLRTGDIPRINNKAAGDSWYIY